MAASVRFAARILGRARRAKAGAPLAAIRKSASDARTIRLIASQNVTAPKLDGEPWEMKRISSSDPRKIKRRMVEAKKQSGNVIVDPSLSEITAEKARETIEQVFDDPQLKRVALIKEGFVEEFKK